MRTITSLRMFIITFIVRFLIYCMILIFIHISYTRDAVSHLHFLAEEGCSSNRNVLIQSLKANVNFFNPFDMRVSSPN